MLAEKFLAGTVGLSESIRQTESKPHLEQIFRSEIETFAKADRLVAGAT